MSFQVSPKRTFGYSTPAVFGQGSVEDFYTAHERHPVSGVTRGGGGQGAGVDRVLGRVDVSSLRGLGLRNPDTDTPGESGGELLLLWFRSLPVGTEPTVSVGWECQTGFATGT